MKFNFAVRTFAFVGVKSDPAVAKFDRTVVPKDENQAARRLEVVHSRQLP